jgi:hypothetical protein
MLSGRRGVFTIVGVDHVDVKSLANQEPFDHFDRKEVLRSLQPTKNPSTTLTEATHHAPTDYITIGVYPILPAYSAC